MTFYPINIAPLMYLEPPLKPFAINPVKRGAATFSRCQTVPGKAAIVWESSGKEF